MTPIPKNSINAFIQFLGVGSAFLAFLFVVNNFIIFNFGAPGLLHTINLGELSGVKLPKGGFSDYALILGFSQTATVLAVIGYSAWYYVLARYPVAMVMPVLLLLPVSTILGAVTFLGERPDAWVLIGGAVVVTGVGIVIIDPKAMRTAAADKKAADTRSDT